MGSPNYITQGNNGIANINCALVPDRGFLDAVKTKNIVKFRIMSRQEKSANESYVPGGPDVVVQHITGETQIISRKELTKNFIHASGNKIKLSILKNNTQYLAYNTCKENYKVMKLPNNCIATLPNSTQTKPGYYIVARVDGNGQIDRSSITAISPNAFKKMFKVSMNAVIKRHMGANSKKNKTFSLFSKDRNRQAAIRQSAPTRITPTFNSSDIGMNPANINIGSINDRTPQTQQGTQQSAMWKPNMNRKIVGNGQNSGVTNNKSTYKYKVTAKVVDMNGRMLGFAVQEIATGNSRNLKVNELTQLCVNKLVENVMAVRNQRGNLYLKGNGCSLESLPQVIA